jgi:ABC-type transporter Mla subunit MlaD
MNGIDPYATLQRAAGRITESQDPAELDRLLDDIEYLYEALDPELQGLAEQVMERLRERIGELRAQAG